MKSKKLVHCLSKIAIREAIISNKWFLFLMVSILTISESVKCTKENLIPTDTKIEAILTDYHSLYIDTIQIFLAPSVCNDNSFVFHVRFFDKQFAKMHNFILLYYGFNKQKPAVNGKIFCTELTTDEKRKFTPFFTSAAYYLEYDVASTFYFLDTNKINKFEIDFNDKTQHRIKFDLNLVKGIGPGRNTIGPGIDSFHIIAPEFLAKVWY